MKRAGFTLLEMTIAVAVTALLVVSVSAATAGLARSVASSSEESRLESQRARLVQILTADWRLRIRILPTEKNDEILRLVTSSDSLGAPEQRTVGDVRYFQTDNGLVREEAGRQLLLGGLWTIQFWDGRAWLARPSLRVLALSLQFGDHSESVTIW